MDVIRTIKPGRPGSRRFQKHWGDRLVAVRYREHGETLYTTVEIIVDERQRASATISLVAAHSRKRQQIVAVRIAWEESTLRDAAKENGARWSRQLRHWLMTYNTAVVLGMQNRIVDGLAETCTDIDISFEV